MQSHYAIFTASLTLFSSVEGQTATGSRYFHPAGPTGCLLRMLSHIFGWVRTGRKKNM